jgi:hypothetical protein
MPGMRFSIGFRIYSIVGLSFCGLIGLAMLQINTLATSLKAQRQIELSHLGQLAVDVAQEEYDAGSGTIRLMRQPRPGPRLGSPKCAMVTATISGSTILAR